MQILEIVFLLSNLQKKLIKVNLGNISNSELIRIFTENIQKVELISQNNLKFIIEIDIENINYITL